MNKKEILKTLGVVQDYLPYEKLVASEEARGDLTFAKTKLRSVISALTEEWFVYDETTKEWRLK